MPIYEYECRKCSHKYEQRRSFTDESPSTCPKCKGDGERLISLVPIIFKGSGFYVTDYKGNHGHSEPAESSPAPAAPASAAPAAAAKDDAA